MLAGSWSDGADPDRQAVSKLAGIPYDDIVAPVLDDDLDVQRLRAREPRVVDPVERTRCSRRRSRAVQPRAATLGRRVSDLLLDRSRGRTSKPATHAHRSSGSVSSPRMTMYCPMRGASIDAASVRATVTGGIATSQRDRRVRSAFVDKASATVPSLALAG